MKTIYQCEVCGFQSEKKDEIKKCEKQGRENKFSINEKVQAYVPGIGGGVVVKATVRGIHFKRKTHLVIYDLSHSWKGLRLRDSSGKETDEEIFRSIPQSNISSI